MASTRLQGFKAARPAPRGHHPHSHSPAQCPGSGHRKTAPAARPSLHTQGPDTTPRCTGPNLLSEMWFVSSEKGATKLTWIPEACPEPLLLPLTGCPEGLWPPSGRCTLWAGPLSMAAHATAVEIHPGLPWGLAPRSDPRTRACGGEGSSPTQERRESHHGTGPHFRRPSRSHASRGALASSSELVFPEFKR